MRHPLFDPDDFNYGVLNALAAQVTDLEDLRIAMSSRHRLLVQPADQVDEDGIARGLGLPENDPLIVAPMGAVVDGARALERQATATLERYMTQSPWGPWLDNSFGVGAKGLARLLGATGDPYWHTAEDRPRLVSELWSYCGYAVIGGRAPARERGQQANWSHDARKRAWLIASATFKVGGPYRELYAATKERYADATHAVECKRCSPTGKPPAPVGSPLRPAHIHARAVRAVSKQLLKDIWLESRRQHGVTDDAEAVA